MLTDLVKKAQVLTVNPDIPGGGGGESVYIRTYVSLKT